MANKIKYFKCKTCGIEVKGKDKGRFINFAISLNTRCAKCEMNRRTDLDRTGRHSKKDKAKDKSMRERLY